MCLIIQGFPPARRKDAIVFACIAVGKSAEPTGLRLHRDRPIKLSYWDLTIDDFRQRMVELVEDVGMDESAVVLGVVGYLDCLYERRADHGFSEQAYDNHIETIERLRQELKKPIADRTYKASDKEIVAFMQKLQGLLGECEQRRRDAEEALRYLRKKTAEVFTWQLWDELARLRADDLRQLFNDMDDGTDAT